MAKKRPIPFLSFRFYLDAGPGTAEKCATPRMGSNWGGLTSWSPQLSTQS